MMQPQAPPSRRAEVAEKSQRVIPKYKNKLALALSVAQLIFAALALLISLLGFKVHIVGGTGAAAMLVMGALLVTGIFGILSSRKKLLWQILTHHGLAICSVAFVLVLMSSGVHGLHQEKDRPARRHIKASRETLQVFAVVIGFLSLCFLLTSLYNTSRALYYGCCKKASGVRYVSETLRTVEMSTTANYHTNSSEYMASKGEPLNSVTNPNAELFLDDSVEFNLTGKPAVLALNT